MTSPAGSRIEVPDALVSLLNTAVDDELIRRNPCRIKGAGNEPSPERPTITIEQVYTIAEQVRGWATTVPERR